MKRPYFICDQVPSRSQAGSSCPSHGSLSQPPQTRAVGQQANAELGADRRERAGRAAIEERAAHLVRHDLDAARERHPQVRGVDVGEPEMPDEPLALQILQRKSASSHDGSA